MANSAPQRLLAGWAPILLILLTLAILPLFLVFDRSPLTTNLELLKQNGKLRVLTLNGPTSYYEGVDGPTGLEYELAKGFANSLGVQLEMEVAENFGAILPRLKRGDAHLAAAGITVTEERKKIVRFTEPYQEIRQQVAYLRGTNRPKSVEDLIGRDLVVVAGSSFAERLRELKAQFPKLTWTETNEKSVDELLGEVWEGLLELTISDSNILSVLRQYYPQLQVAFDIQTPEPLAWALPITEDDSIFNAANAYLKDLEQSGELKRLLERYYGAARKFNYVNLARYRERVSSVLPQFEKLFKRAALLTDKDWRLIAAQAYQESQWDPKAVSPTGVVGMMQLTSATAERFNVFDRSDTAESIKAGAQYLRNLKDRLPERIVEPDRTWMALAAYNVGMGHLEDARVLTQKNGGNPDIWIDVVQHLPLLSKPKWFKQTQFGYARGHEPVAYVTRIRSFYDILVKMRPDIPVNPDKFKLNVPAL